MVNIAASHISSEFIAAARGSIPRIRTSKNVVSFLYSLFVLLRFLPRAISFSPVMVIGTIMCCWFSSSVPTLLHPSTSRAFSYLLFVETGFGHDFLNLL